MSFDSYIEPLLEREGNYVNDRRDSGGETIFGITIAVARAHGYTDAMRNMSKAQARAIYRSAYWDALKLDAVNAIMPTVADELLDTGVNLGIVQAGKFLQRALNAFNQESMLYAEVPVDGLVGAMTLAALKDYARNRGANAEVVLFRALNAQQGAFYLDLAARRPKDEAFVFGWFRARVA